VRGAAEPDEIEHLLDPLAGDPRGPRGDPQRRPAGPPGMNTSGPVSAPICRSGSRRSRYGCPLMVARPESGVARPSSSRMVVDFPAPFGPRNPVMRPGASSKDRSLTAVTVPYRLVSASTAMVLIAVPP